jgi:hypothetical protein
MSIDDQVMKDYLQSVFRVVASLSLPLTATLGTWMASWS